MYEWRHVHTFSQEGRFTVNIKSTANEQGSERWKTKNAWHRSTLAPLTQTYSQSVSCYLLPVTGVCGDQWTLSGNHLFVTSVLDQVPRCALDFSSQRLTGPKALFSGDASGFCELAMLQVMSSNPGPTPKASSTAPSERVWQKIS